MSRAIRNRMRLRFLCVSITNMRQRYSFLITRHSRDLLALGFLVLLTLLFFWPVFFAGYWLPRGGGDLVSFLWPQYSFAGEAIRSGSIPLWNPYLYSGAPFLADNQAGVLYPINLLAFLVFPNLSYQVMEGLVIFHLWLAGAAMYVGLRLWPAFTPRPPFPNSSFDSTLFRSGSEFERGGGHAPLFRKHTAFSGEGLGVRILPALLGAIAFMFNDVLLVHIGNLNLIAVAAWLPLILALYARGLSERRASWIIGSGVVFAIALLAGHAQMTAITLVGLMAVAVWQIIIAPRGRGRVIGLAMLTPLIALGLSAAQLLPSLEMTRYSLRAGLSYEEATAYSLPPAALASTFSPLLFGRGAAEFWGSWERVETLYVGVVPLILAGLACRRKWRDASWLFLALGLLGLLIALGQHTPIYSVVHSLPVLGGLRVPARFILLTNFSLAALAAIGLQRFMTESFSIKRVLGWGGAVMISGALALVLAYQSAGAIDRGNNLVSSLSFLLFAGVAGAILILTVKSKIQNQKSAILLIGLLSLELVLLGSGVEVDRNDPTLGYQHQAVVDFLKNDGGEFRLENASSVWQPDAALVHRVNDIGGIFNPLGLASYETYRGGMGNRGSPLYNFLGTKYVLANKDQPPGDVSFVPVFNGDPQIDVYLNTNALPRAQLIDRAQIVHTGEEAWQAIHAVEFDPSQEVVIENGEELSGAENQSGGRALAFAAQSNDRVELMARTESPAYLVMSDVYYPGWTATIDDQPTALYPANFAFRAVLVPPGEHRVAFAFEPVLWRAGVMVSVSTILTLVMYGIWRWQRGRQ
jgi:hypothetical protein